MKVIIGARPSIPAGVVVAVHVGARAKVTRVRVIHATGRARARTNAWTSKHRRR